MKNDFEESADTQATKSDALLDAACREAGRELECLSIRQKAQRKSLKSGFNVFTALLKYDDEVKLHSGWLHYLLNPAAGHDCGALFLKLFIETLCERGAQPHNSDPWNSMGELKAFDGESANVKKEHWVTFGRLDIHIECPTWGVIIVENKTRLDKTRLDETPNQIRDYVKHCLDRYEQPRQKFFVLFLTPEGSQSKTAGEHSDNYLRISYRDHILLWLEKCLCATYQYVHINQALQQYRIVVNQLLNINSDSAYMKDVTEILKKYPAIVEHSSEINQGVNDLRENYWKAFIKELQKQLREKRGLTLGPEVKYKTSLRYELVNGFQRDSYPEFKTIFEYFEGEKCLLIGEYRGEKTGKLQQEMAPFKTVQIKLDARFGDNYITNLKDDAWPLGWVKVLEEFMKPQFLARNATRDSRPLPDLVACVVNAISDYLEVVKRGWPTSASTS